MYTCVGYMYLYSGVHAQECVSVGCMHVGDVVHVWRMCSICVRVCMCRVCYMCVGGMYVG